MSAHLLGTAFAADMGTAQRKLVLLKLVDHCHDDGTKIFPAMSTVAVAAQCSVRSVQREIRLFVETGLLILVKEGGKGKGSTNQYAMNLAVLERIKQVGWNAWRAETTDTTCSGSVDDEAEAKGDTLSPLDGDLRVTETPLRVTETTRKGDTRSHPTPQEPLEPSQVRAGTSPTDNGKPDDLDTPSTGDTTSGGQSNSADASPTFEAFEDAWPWKVSGSWQRARKVWDGLSGAERQAAIDGIQPYKGLLSREKQTHGRAAWTYLQDKLWVKVAKAIEADPLPYVPPTAKPTSPLWSAALIEHLRLGQTLAAVWLLKGLETRQEACLRFGEQRDRELTAMAKGYERLATHHDRWLRWKAWMTAQVIANPQRDGRVSSAHRNGKVPLLERLPRDPDKPFWLSLPSDAQCADLGITLPELDTIGRDERDDMSEEDRIAYSEEVLARYRRATRPRSQFADQDDDIGPEAIPP